jgi:hypothetical protein
MADQFVWGSPNYCERFEICDQLGLELQDDLRMDGSTVRQPPTKMQKGMMYF